MSATKQRPVVKVFTEAQIDHPGPPPEDVELAPPPTPDEIEEAPDVPLPSQTRYTDYSEEIARYGNMLVQAATRRDNAATPAIMQRFDSEADQLRRAVMLYERAQYIKPVMRQFGSWRHKKISIRLPPKIMGLSNREDLHLVGANYRIMTADPRFIALCLDMVKARSMTDFYEMKVGLSALFTPDEGFIAWVEPDMMIAMQNRGAVRNW